MTDWPRSTVVVTGAARSGAACARALLGRGARVIVVDERPLDPGNAVVAELTTLGADVRGATAGVETVTGADLVVASPGWPPSAPVLRAAAAAGVPVWGEVELAWRLRPAGAADWLVVTGTNGKTTTVRMLAAMLTAAGHRALAVGNVGTPVVSVVTGAERYDVLAVELSSFQLHGAPPIAPLASTVLNLAPDHLDWHGTYAAYAAAKGFAFVAATQTRVVNVDDPAVVELAQAYGTAPVVPFTLGDPPEGGFGVRGGCLVDRAFGRPEAGRDGVELAAVTDVRPSAPHNVANALAAAALARSYGVTPGAVAAGLLAFRPDPHRIAYVATVAGVDYVDDSKATNPHAAAASLGAYPAVVWIAGGLAKGADFDELVGRCAPRLRAVVLLGRDRAVIRGALVRHAPEVPVVEVDTPETGPMSVPGELAMRQVVAAAVELARPGDTVLLAPGCASWDMFSDYGARGDLFAAAVRALSGAAS